MYGVQLIDVDHGEPGPVDGNWNTPADIEMLRALFKDFNPITRAYLQKIEHAEKWQIAVGPELETWRSNHGRIGLLGDAAHAMIPHAAQGLSQGIEDGISLARMLRGATSGSNGIPVATEAWVRLRKPRAELFVQRSMNNARLRSLPDGPAQMARDEHLAKSAHIVPKELADVEMDMTADQNSPQFMKWVREYDVVSEVRRLVMHFVPWS
jgi:salicylate hydroxylase